MITINKKCEKCRADIIKQTVNKKEIKIRSKIIVVNEQGVFAVCKSCSTENKIESAEVKYIEEFICQIKTS